MSVWKHCSLYADEALPAHCSVLFPIYTLTFHLVVLVCVLYQLGVCDNGTSDSTGICYVNLSYDRRISALTHRLRIGRYNLATVHYH